jgi:hypothetical protein
VIVQVYREEGIWWRPNNKLVEINFLRRNYAKFVHSNPAGFQINKNDIPNNEKRSKTNSKNYMTTESGLYFKNDMSPGIEVFHLL